MPDNDLLDLTGALAQTADLLELMTTNPLKAADALEDWASSLLDLATTLRSQPRNDKDLVSNGGFGDRVKAKVYGPDGRLKGFGRTA